MPEIRIYKKNDGKNEYRKYSQSVQNYHSYDIFYDDYEINMKTNPNQFIADRYHQIIILAGMNENEYQELQESYKDHIIQKRISLTQQKEELLKLSEKSPDKTIYIYCIESIKDGLCIPYKVFRANELPEARQYANELNQLDNTLIQLCEGLYDSEGNMLGDHNLSFVIEEWSQQD